MSKLTLYKALASAVALVILGLVVLVGMVT
jgi:hypothetical protein